MSFALLLQVFQSPAISSEKVPSYVLCCLLLPSGSFWLTLCFQLTVLKTHKLSLKKDKQFLPTTEKHFDRHRKRSILVWYAVVCLGLELKKLKKKKKNKSPPLQPSLSILMSKQTFLSIFMSKYWLRSSGNCVCIPQAGPALWKLESGRLTPLWMGSRERMFLPKPAIPPCSATTHFSTLHSVSYLHYLSLKNTQPWQVSHPHGRREQRPCNSVHSSSSYHWLSPSQAFQGFP